MPFSTQLIKKLDQLQPDLKAVFLELLTEIEQDREERITRIEFLEFAKTTEENFQKVWKAIGKLTEAQQRTEQRVEDLAEAQKRTEERVEELAQAQKQTEQRVEELAAAQKRTEQRVEELAEAQKRTEQRVEELAQAQKRTEQRVEELAQAQKRTEQRVEELVEAQKRTEERVEELAQAQKRTEQRVEELAAAQKRTEQRMEELAEAQKRIEKVVEKLIRRVDQMAIELGGISNTIGYNLEDRAYPVLKKLLKKEFGLEVNRLYRRNLVYTPQKYDEINIYGEARRNGRKVYVIGESKAQFGVRDVLRFTQLLRRVQTHLGEEIFPVALAYQYHPQAEEKLKEQGIRYFWSYELSE